MIGAEKIKAIMQASNLDSLNDSVIVAAVANITTLI